MDWVHYIEYGHLTSRCRYRSSPPFQALVPGLNWGWRAVGGARGDTVSRGCCRISSSVRV